jgi:hypothetical protein
MNTHRKKKIGFDTGVPAEKSDEMKTHRKKKIGFDTGVPAEKSDEMKTYRNEEAGFEIDVPEEWSLPTGGTQDDIRCLPDEAIDFAPLPISHVQSMMPQQTQD